jgi:LytR cell envelope-related transcriptional attenuator
MDHPAELRSPHAWRSAALIATSVAAVELFILLIVGLFLFGKFFNGQVDRATDPTTVAQAAIERAAGEAKPAPTERKETRPLLERNEISVVVLNGNGVGGAAATSAQRVRAKRYRIAATGNAPRTDFRRSLVMYRPGFEREAERLARDLGMKRAVPLDGLRVRDLQGAHLAYIVGG